MTDFLRVETPATIDESAGMDLAHPLNEAACEALTFTSDCSVRCKRRAVHWTHEVEPGKRLVLCEQHFKILERYRRRGTVGALLSVWSP